MRPLLVLAAWGAAQAPDGSEALARAEELACLGRHRDARELYERIAREHPETPAGKLAAKRSLPSALLGACPLVTNGPAENRVDVVLLGDGYTLDHQRAFDELAEDVPPLFERVEPFREYWSYFDFVRGVCLSAEAGVDGYGREYDTLLGGLTLGTEQGHVGLEPERVHEVLREIPESDGIAMVFVKLGILGHGYPGIGVVGGRSAPTVIHEFGHAFAGLGDEYSTFTNHRGAVRDCPNVSSTDDPALVPWRHWLEARHPEVGINEGANGQPMDAWRPTPSGCLMNDARVFCPPCREAIVLRIYSLVDPIDAVEPRPPPPGIREPILLWDDPVEIRVRTMRPATHDLELEWWVEPAAKYPATPGERAPASAVPAVDRRDRGPLAARAERPTKRMGAGTDGLGVLRLSRADLEPGTYRVTCRVRDTTLLRGERFPWVLRDEHGLLESERVWWLEVR